MGYYINLQKAIDYIEDHLESQVELEQIAKCAGYSIPHFYRVFGAIVGCSVKEYVRRRKLSEAVLEIVKTNQSITDIAFKYGYESHEAFTRTFKSVYGVPPSSFRKSHREPNLFTKVNLLSLNEENRRGLLKPEIVYKDERLLLGIARKINQSENMKHGLLSNVKEEFMKIVNTIEDKINPEIYYAVYDYNSVDICNGDDEVNYMYYYCVEVSKYDHIPQGMISIVIPQAKYAVFTYNKNNNTLNGEKLNQSIYEYIDGTWLPNSGYKLSETIDYEVIYNYENRVDCFISVD